MDSTISANQGQEIGGKEALSSGVADIASLYSGMPGTGDTGFVGREPEAELADSESGKRAAAIMRRGIGETDKKPGDDFDFDDVKPTLDAWLEAYEETFEGLISSAG